MRNSIPISMWAAEDRPMNKIQEGVASLSDAELLSIIIGSGTDKYNQVDIARMLLSEYDNSLSNILHQTVKQLSRHEGIGESTAKRILASLDLGRRMLVSKKPALPDLGTATRVYNHMYPYIGSLDVEEFWLLLMNHSFKLIKKVKIATGGITEVSVDIRLIIRERSEER